MIGSFRSYCAGLQAGLRLGRAYRLRSIGRKEDAFRVAREGLAVLGRPFVKRLRPTEGAALACLTMLVEELALEFDWPGASLGDLGDSLEFIKKLPAKPSTEVQELKAWVPYLEAKTGVASSA